MTVPVLVLVPMTVTDVVTVFVEVTVSVLVVETVPVPVLVPVVVSVALLVPMSVAEQAPDVLSALRQTAVLVVVAVLVSDDQPESNGRYCWLPSQQEVYAESGAKNDRVLCSGA